jgi:integrase
MVRHYYSILFYLRKSKRNPEMGIVYARLTFDKVPITLCSLNIHVLKKDFNTKKQTLSDGVLNNKLIRFKNDVVNLIESMPNPSAEKIRDIVLGRNTLNPTIINLLQSYMNENQDSKAHNTNRDWNAKITKLETYLKATKQENLEGRQFGIVAFNRFKSWLIKDQDNTENSANKYGVKFRKALKWAVMQGHLNENPLRDCDLKITYKPKLIHLEWEWVEKLYQYPFDSRLKKAVDMYVFSCCTGICYADLMNLTDRNLEDDKDLGIILTNRRQKTKKTFCTPLRSFAKDLYQVHGSINNIPRISGQKVNDYIKIALHKIEYEDAENITFHTARNTFINHCLNDLEIEPHIIATFTGHANTDEIYHYAKMKRNTAIKIFDKKQEEYNRKE